MHAELLAWVDQGKLTPKVFAQYPLERAVDALKDVSERRVQGKVALVP